MKKESSELLLLDVNVLLALAWPNHQFHARAIRRLEAGRDRWATCALTQLGFIRLSSNPAVVGVRKSAWEAASMMALLAQDRRHVYLDSLPPPGGSPFLDVYRNALGHQQVTDCYLVGLARRHRAILLSFDTRLGAFSHPAGVVELLYDRTAFKGSKLHPEISA